ncbi:hypothetical protein JCM8208_005313, partial [Rhodotorula glutinis]
HNHLAIACAVISVYFIDFSVNVIQAMDRSLLVDVVPPAQQPAVNAWAGRMFGFGAVFGYWIGGIDLVWWTRGWLGGEQLKVLTIFTSVLLIGTHAVTVTCVRERILISRADDDNHDAATSSSRGSGALRALADVWHTIRHLPRPIQQVFNVQFTGWIGWFPVLFFSTTWVAEMYVKTRWDGGGPGSELKDAPEDVRERATRAGTHAMLWHSVVSLATSIVLPPLVAASAGASSSPQHDRPSSRRGPTTTTTTTSSSSSSSLLARAKSLLPHLSVALPLPWLSLPLLWALSNTLFSLLLFATLFARSVEAASAIVAMAGFAWAVTNWAPFALLGDLILRTGTSPNGSLSLGSPNTSHVMLHQVDHDRSSRPRRDSAESWGDEDDGAEQRERMLDPSASSAAKHGDAYSGSNAGASRSPSHFDDPHRTPTTTLDHHHHHDNAFSLGEDLDSDDSPTFSAVDPSAPRTPTTARSLYFDAASITGSSSGGGFDAQGAMSRSTSAHSFASASSGGGSATPTLTASPGGGDEWGSAGRTRGDSSASEGTMQFPPNHGSVGVDLFAANPYHPPTSSSAHHEHAYGADPYAYPAAAVRHIDFGAPHGANDAAGASTSTIHLPPPPGGVAAFGRVGAGSSAGSPAPGAAGLYALDGGESDDQGRTDGGDAHVLQIRHSDSFELDEDERLHLGGGGGAGDERRRGVGGGASAQGTPRIFVGGGEGDEDSPEEWGAQDDEEGGGQGGGAGQQQVGGGDQTGVILGCHNIYLVLPQFLVTALSSIIFALLAPHHSVLGHHTPAHHSASSDTGLVGGVGGSNDEEDGFGDLGESDARRRNLVVRAVRVVGGAIGEAFAAKVQRQDEGDGEVELPPGGEAGWDALGLIFRVGGVAAACSAYICFAIWRESLQAERRARSAQRGYRLTG